MKVNAYKTHKIQPNENLTDILDKYLPHLEEKSVVAIASKIVGICEGRVVKKDSQEQKDALVTQEADYYLSEPHMGFLLTINHNMLVVNAGIDASNGDNVFSLWPKDPQKSVNTIREYLIKKHNLNTLGIILTDSKLSPLRWGVTGYALTHSGFHALNNYIGKSDIFGNKMLVEQTNVADSLATTATLTMGEGNEQQPLAIITELPFVTFQKQNPTEEELRALKMELTNDIYSDLLTAVEWKKGKKNQ